MKKLKDFRLVAEFLEAQGIEATVGMVALEETAWADLVILAETWRQELDEVIAKHDEMMAGLSEDELAQRDREAIQAARLEDEKLLYHSSGYKPEKV